MDARLELRLMLAAWLGVSIAGASAPCGSAGEPLAYRSYGYAERSYGATASAGTYSLRDASVTLNEVGNPHGYPYGRTWRARPWYASPYRYQSYYYRPWYTYSPYYPRYYGAYSAYGGGGYGPYARDPWPYEYPPYGPPCAPWDDAPPHDYGGCYYW
jgi:hypothetical protein